MTENGTVDKRRVWRHMWMMLALFVLPSLLAVFLFYNPWQFSLSHVNKGLLLTPPKQVETIKAISQDKWLLLLVVESSCHDECLKTLDKMKRIRMALGKDMYRINQALVSTQTLPAEKIKRLGEVKGLDTQVVKLGEPMTAGIYIQDPLGNIMLTYSPEVKPNDVYSDLTRLLKVSKIG